MTPPLVVVCRVDVGAVRQAACAHRQPRHRLLAAPAVVDALAGVLRLLLAVWAVRATGALPHFLLWAEVDGLVAVHAGRGQGLTDEHQTGEVLIPRWRLVRRLTPRFLCSHLVR